jgi:Tfp pilus assembly PilM family ATPase
MRSIGIDIGSYSLKLAEVESSPKGTTLLRYQEIKLSPDINSDRSLEIIEALRSISFSGAKSENKNDVKTVIAIAQNQASIRLKRFPFRKRAQIITSTPFELEDEIPLDIDSSCFDVKIIEFFGQASDVLTVAVPNEAIAKAISAAKDGGLDPDMISVEGMALANLFEPWMR